jgi:folate-binding protein YgfZ
VILATHKILSLTILTDNRQIPSDRAFALTDHGVVALNGPDAVGFAQAQFANDLNALEDGRWQWNAWLTPKGRVIAVFAVLRLASDRLLLVLPDTPAIELATALKRFVFRKKVIVELPADLQVQGRLGMPDAAQGALMQVTDGRIELDLGSSHQPRALCLSSHQVEEDAAALAHWRDIDLRHGLPRLDASQREQWTPQQLSLDRLRAFSVKKGCYPGQEIVARTHFLGKAKRGLALLESDALLIPGAPVEDAERNLGQVVSASTRAPGPALAVLPLEHPPTPLHSADVTLRQLPLLDGLAR